jgi:hypothetical protein
VGAEGTDEVTKVDICLAQWGLLHLLMAVVWAWVRQFKMLTAL